MKAKTIAGFLMIMVCLAFLVGTVSAAQDNLVDITEIDVNGIDATGSEDVAVIAGELLTVTVYFTADEDASDVRIRAELEGEKVDVSETSKYFDVEEDKRYSKTLNIRVPYELKDDWSDDLSLELKIWNSDYETEDEITLRVQRESYTADIMSIDVDQDVEAGETLPVTIVLKNTGYNELDDLYVTVSIDELGVQRTSYFGDVIAVECCDGDDCECDEDEEDTISGRFYLDIPYDTTTGIYTLSVEVRNSEMGTIAAGKQIYVQNDFSTGSVIATSTKKSAAVGEEAEYSLLLVNPTNKLKVYRVVTESSSGLTSSADSVLVSIPAGSSKAVTIRATAESSGEHSFDVNVLSGESLVGMVTLSLDADGVAVNAVAVLTVILAIIFLVLLAVLIVLLRRKPEQEEFGESYY